MTLVPAERADPVSRPETAPGAARRGVNVRAGLLIVVTAAALFLLSLYPRAINLGGNLTSDEPNWLGRSARFGRALAQDDPAGTYQSGHPGVMTMWTASIGMGTGRALALSEGADTEGPTPRRSASISALEPARRAFGVLTSLAVVAVALLTWRLFGAAPGLLAGVLIGLEPFLLAHSSLVHVDANLAIWMSVCVLAALVYFWAGGSWGYLALSGVAAGLAFLSKAPSAFLPLFVPIVALTALANNPSYGISPDVPEEGTGRLPDRRIGRRAGLLRLLIDGLIWGVLALMAVLTLWPAFRADPVGTLLRMVEYTESIGGAEHDNFFLGQVVGDPGPLYYPVALAFRLTPITMLGLVLLGLGLGPRLQKGSALSRRAPLDARRAAPVLGLLVAYCVLFIAMMTLAPKKFDRYLLPIFPTLEVLAAVGFWLAVRWLPRSMGRWALPTALLVVGIAQAMPSALVHPYYLAYYNPLLGGGAAAERTILIGRGEGLDIVIDYLNAQPDADRSLVAAGVTVPMMRQLVGPLAVRNEDPAAAYADYVVHYVNRVQREYVDAVRPLTRGRASALDVTINGIRYARVFRTTSKPERNAGGTEFGGAARLERAVLLAHASGDAERDEIRGGDRLEVRLWWTALGSAEEGLAAVLELVDGRGETVGRAEGPIGSTEGRGMRRGGEVGGVSHWLDVPERPGQYDVVVGLRRPDGARLAVTTWPPSLVEPARRPPGHVLVETVEAQ